MLFAFSDIIAALATIEMGYPYLRAYEHGPCDSPIIQREHRSRPGLHSCVLGWPDQNEMMQQNKIKFIENKVKIITSVSFMQYLMRIIKAILANSTVPSTTEKIIRSVHCKCCFSKDRIYGTG